MTPRTRRLLLPLAVLALGITMLGAAVFVTMNPAQMPQASAIGGPFKLMSANGRVVTNEDMRGAPFLIFFGFTHCPDVCPTALLEISEVLKAVGTDKKIGALFVSVDPERDTPEKMQDYVSSFDKRIVGLSGDRPSIDAAMKAYRVYARKVPGENGEYTMDHSAIVYLMDKQGRFVNALRLDQTPQEVAKEIARWM